MPHLFKDLIVNEGDHKARVNLINRDGSVAVHEVTVELASTAAQQGDRWGAKEANLLLKIGDDGVPYVDIDGYYNAAKVDTLIKGVTATYTATITASWSGSGPWTQNVAVSGITAADNPTIDIVLSGIDDTDRLRLEAWGMVSRITTYTGGITVRCLDDKPSVEIPIQIKAVR